VVGAPGKGAMARQFHWLAFERPDAHPRASGMATRMSGLAQTLAKVGCATRLWLVGGPELASHETRDWLHLHRWCQWISGYHPAVVPRLGSRADGW
jgi:hypothetical protein